MSTVARNRFPDLNEFTVTATGATVTVSSNKLTLHQTDSNTGNYNRIGVVHNIGVGMDSFYTVYWQFKAPTSLALFNAQFILSQNGTTLTDNFLGTVSALIDHLNVFKLKDADESKLGSFSLSAGTWYDAYFSSDGNVPSLFIKTSANVGDIRTSIASGSWTLVAQASADFSVVPSINFSVQLQTLATNSDLQMGELYWSNNGELTPNIGSMTASFDHDNQGVQLDWDDVSVPGYNVYRDASPLVFPSVNSYLDTDIAAVRGLTIQYQVEAADLNAITDQTTSNEVDVLDLNDAPANFTAVFSASAGGNYINFDPVSGPPQGDPDHYTVFRDDVGDLADIGGPPFLDTGVLPSHSYIYSVVGSTINAARQTQETAPITVTVPLPQIPTSLAAALPPGPFIRGDVDNDGVITTADRDIIIYRITHGNYGSFSVGPFADYAADVNANGAINVVDVQYIINVLNNSGPPPPAPYPNLGYPDPPSSTIYLSWADGGDPDSETGFLIERSIVGGGSGFSQIADVSGSTYSYHNSGLNPLTKYYYRIRSYTIINGTTYYSSYSSEVNATTLASPSNFNKIKSRIPGAGNSRGSTFGYVKMRSMTL